MKPPEKIVKASIACVYGLQSSGAVGVYDRRHAFGFSVPEGHHSEHERTFPVHVSHVEPFIDTFGQDDRCEGTKIFPKLDRFIQAILQFAITSIAQDASSAQRARPKLRSALKPAAGLPLDEPFHGIVDQAVRRNLDQARSGSNAYVNNRRSIN